MKPNVAAASRPRLRRLSAIIGLVVLACSFVLVPRASGASVATRWFWVQNGSGWRYLRCVRLAQTPRVQVWARNGVSGGEARSIAREFERRVLPTDERIFGTPDHLFPVLVLLVPLPAGTLGYFNQNDFPISSRLGVLPYSNRANILYVRPPSSMPDGSKMPDTMEVIAHELQHLIDYRLRVVDHRLLSQEDWLNEGLSFYAQMANSYWTPRDLLKVQAAGRQPHWPVTSLNERTPFLLKHARTAYGRAGLFVSYLAAQYGDPFIKRLMLEPDTGMRAIDDELKERPSGASAPLAFANWSVAQVLQRKGVFGYGVLNSRLSQPPHPIAALTIKRPKRATFRSTAVRLALRPWGQAFLRFEAARPAPLRISIDGLPKQLRAAAILQNSTNAVAPQVRWYGFDAAGHADLKITDFGQFYDRLTVAISDVSFTDLPLAAPPQPIRVTARLVDVGDHD